MRLFALVCIVMSSTAAGARAQDPPPPIPRVVVDLHGTIPVFPSDLDQLAASRGLTSLAELPGTGIGVQAGIHLYLFKWKAMTVGAGGEVMVARATSSPDAALASTLRPVEERLVSLSPQLSFNFGTGNGWSYLSAGVGRSQWSLHAVGEPSTAADSETHGTFNYGGGARWFIKTHLAFSFDIRVYEVQPGTRVGERPVSPLARVVTIGAGISVK